MNLCRFLEASIQFKRCFQGELAPLHFLTFIPSISCGRYVRVVGGKSSICISLGVYPVHVEPARKCNQIWQICTRCVFTNYPVDRI